jgi:hypothetical protein
MFFDPLWTLEAAAMAIPILLLIAFLSWLHSY